jgi:hypothetical protein
MFSSEFHAEGIISNDEGCGVKREMERRREGCRNLLTI